MHIVDMQKETNLTNLETEFELQDKITAAYHKLSRDTAVTRSIRRDRQHCYRKAYNKVRNYSLITCEISCEISRYMHLVISQYLTLDSVEMILSEEIALDNFICIFLVLHLQWKLTVVMCYADCKDLFWI